MIEIIKSGDPKKNCEIITFWCDNCGCAWKANADDYTMAYTGSGQKLFISVCPNCKEEVIEES